jgi:hypothetical protein
MLDETLALAGIVVLAVTRLVLVEAKCILVVVAVVVTECVLVVVNDEEEDEEEEKGTAEVRRNGRREKVTMLAIDGIFQVINAISNGIEDVED